MRLIPFEVTFPVFNEKHETIGIVLLAFLDTDNTQEVSLIVQLRHGWELWSLDTFVGCICLWQDRDNNMHPIEDLIRSWLAASVVQQPRVKYVDRATQVFVPSPQEVEQLVKTRTCLFSDAAMADSMAQWLESKNLMSQWFAAANDTMTSVTRETYTALKSDCRAQLCEQCKRSCVSLCQDPTHTMCATHFGQYIQCHARLCTFAALKQLPACLTCDAPVCIDMLFQAASRLNVCNDVLDAIVDIGGAFAA